MAEERPPTSRVALEWAGGVPMVDGRCGTYRRTSRMSEPETDRISTRPTVSSTAPRAVRRSAASHPTHAPPPPRHGRVTLSQSNKRRTLVVELECTRHAADDPEKWVETAEAS
jgi:hypothetical protein